MKMALHERERLAMLHMVECKRLTQIATTMHWKPPSCIVLCSVDFLHSVVEQGLVLDFHDDGG